MFAYLNNIYLYRISKITGVLNKLMQKLIAEWEKTAINKKRNCTIGVNN